MPCLLVGLITAFALAILGSHYSQPGPQLTLAVLLGLCWASTMRGRTSPGLAPDDAADDRRDAADEHRHLPHRRGDGGLARAGRHRLRQVVAALQRAQEGQGLGSEEEADRRAQALIERIGYVNDLRFFLAKDRLQNRQVVEAVELFVMQGEKLPVLIDNLAVLADVAKSPRAPARDPNSASPESWRRPSNRRSIPSSIVSVTRRPDTWSTNDRLSMPFITQYHADQTRSASPDAHRGATPENRGLVQGFFSSQGSPKGQMIGDVEALAVIDDNGQFVHVGRPAQDAGARLHHGSIPRTTTVVHHR